MIQAAGNTESKIFTRATLATALDEILAALEVPVSPRKPEQITEICKAQGLPMTDNPTTDPIVVAVQAVSRVHTRPSAILAAFEKIAAHVKEKKLLAD